MNDSKQTKFGNESVFLFENAKDKRNNIITSQCLFLVTDIQHSLSLKQQVLLGRHLLHPYKLSINSILLHA